MSQVACVIISFSDFRLSQFFEISGEGRDFFKSIGHTYLMDQTNTFPIKEYKLKNYKEGR